ncbi:MAG: hypothetical protein ACK4Z8_12295, partial [Novosphingobium sp.]
RFDPGRHSDLIPAGIPINSRPPAGGCTFRGSWAVISRDLGHAFHGIAGSHFTPSGRLANGCY